MDVGWICKNIKDRRKNLLKKRMPNMNIKGYFTDSGYMGYVNGRYILFSGESEYYEYVQK